MSFADHQDFIADPEYRDQEWQRANPNLLHGNPDKLQQQLKCDCGGIGGHSDWCATQKGE